MRIENCKKGSKMRVELLYHTPDPERAIATAARLCYSPVGASDLIEKMTDEQIEKVLNTVLSNGHTSTLEHASFTFAIEGVSRVLTHQLVRHRMASYNQQSQRYVKAGEEMDYITPPSISNDPEALLLFEEAMVAASVAYNKLLDAGIAAEDARFVLPNAAETKIVVTMNARELQHFFALRCCNRAQWEINELAHKMLDLVKPLAPRVFLDSGAPCVRGTCPEGKMTCGNPYPKVTR